ncbi:MAG: 2-amino-4-hydroxy-6-hydroxymethyldihydropteridine diphosphokinase [Candidatus Kapabacteria bacterium]|nr:2-amino-4-hydroxy-6-hydroxymethyldihydropteridine diphosphokinase [Candidatus Kapabacteria bacterium]
MIYSDDNENGQHFVLLSLGSNLNDRRANITSAVNKLRDYSIIKNLKCSSYFESEPVGYLNQPWYLNISITGITDLEPVKLLTKIKAIEVENQRIARERWHEREIDIDIILYDSLEFSNEILTIPHPEMHKRKFVLLPSFEIAPKAVHPMFNQNIEELLFACEDKSEVNKFMESL